MRFSMFFKVSKYLSESKMFQIYVLGENKISILNTWETRPTKESYTQKEHSVDAAI
jgi:hypothetical protein